MAGLTLVAVSIYLVQPESNSVNNNSNSSYTAAQKGNQNSNNNQANSTADKAKNNQENASFNSSNIRGKSNISTPANLGKSNASLGSDSKMNSNSALQNNSVAARSTKPTQPEAKRRQVRNILAESMAIRETLIRPESERAQKFQELAEN